LICSTEKRTKWKPHLHLENQNADIKDKTIVFQVPECRGRNEIIKIVNPVQNLLQAQDL
jgi:hypothetical protein